MGGQKKYIEGVRFFHWAIQFIVQCG